MFDMVRFSMPLIGFEKHALPKDDTTPVLDDMVGVLVAENLATCNGHIILRSWDEGASLEASLGKGGQIADGDKNAELGTRGFAQETNLTGDF